jgi:hypothetical protein
VTSRHAPRDVLITLCKDTDLLLSPVAGISLRAWILSDSGSLCNQAAPPSMEFTFLWVDGEHTYADALQLICKSIPLEDAETLQIHLDQLTDIEPSAWEDAFSRMSAINTLRICHRRHSVRNILYALKDNLQSSEEYDNGVVCSSTGEVRRAFLPGVRRLEFENIYFDGAVVQTLLATLGSQAVPIEVFTERCAFSDKHVHSMLAQIATPVG